MDNTFKCPECGYPQYCPCHSCHPIRTGAGFNPWIWMEDGEHIKCAGCGIIKHCDWWLYQEAKHYKLI